jgi:hypothetical protein
MWDADSLTIQRKILPDRSVIFIGKPAAFGPVLPDLECSFGLDNFPLPENAAEQMQAVARVDDELVKVIHFARLALNVHVGMTQTTQGVSANTSALLLDLCGNPNTLKYFVDSLPSATALLGFNLHTLIVNPGSNFAFFRDLLRFEIFGFDTSRGSLLPSRDASDDDLLSWADSLGLVVNGRVKLVRSYQTFPQSQSITQARATRTSTTTREAALSHLRSSFVVDDDSQIWWTYDRLSESAKAALIGGKSCYQPSASPIGSLTFILTDRFKSECQVYAETDVSEDGALIIYSVCGLRGRLIKFFDGLARALQAEFSNVSVILFSASGDLEFFEQSLGFNLGEGNILRRSVRPEAVPGTLKFQSIADFPSLTFPSLTTQTQMQTQTISPTQPVLYPAPYSLQTISTEEQVRVPTTPPFMKSAQDAKNQFLATLERLVAAFTDQYHLKSVPTAVQLALAAQASGRTAQLCASAVALLKLVQPQIGAKNSDSSSTRQCRKVQLTSNSAPGVQTAWVTLVGSRGVDFCYNANELLGTSRENIDIVNLASELNLPGEAIERSFKPEILDFFAEARRLAGHRVLDSESPGMQLFRIWFFPPLWARTRTNLSVYAQALSPEMSKVELDTAFVNKFWRVFGHVVMAAARAIFCLIATKTRLTLETWTSVFTRHPALDVERPYWDFVFDAVARTLDPNLVSAASTVPLLNDDFGFGLRAGLEPTLGKLIRFAQIGLDAFVFDAEQITQKDFKNDFASSLAQNLAQTRLLATQNTSEHAVFLAVCLDISYTYATKLATTTSPSSFILNLFDDAFGLVMDSQAFHVANFSVDIVSQFQEDQRREILAALLDAFAHDATQCGWFFVDDSVTQQKNCCASIADVKTVLDFGPDLSDEPSFVSSTVTVATAPSKIKIAPIPTPTPTLTLTPALKTLTPATPPFPPRTMFPTLQTITNLPVSDVALSVSQPIRLQPHFPGLAPYQKPPAPEPKVQVLTPAPVVPPPNDPRAAVQRLLEQNKERQEAAAAAERAKIRKFVRPPIREPPLADPVPPPLFIEPQKGWIERGRQGFSDFWRKYGHLSDSRLKEPIQKNVTAADGVAIHLFKWKKLTSNVTRLWKSLGIPPSEIPRHEYFWSVYADELEQIQPEAVADRGPYKVKMLVWERLPQDLKAKLTRLNSQQKKEQ